MSIVGVTVCPECDGELKPTGSNEDRPIQRVTQGCPNCSFETNIALLWYPRGGYEVVADVSTVDETHKKQCKKSGDEAATVVVPRESDVPSYYSDEHTRAHHEQALDEVM